MNRIIFSDNGTNTDYSLDLKKYDTQTVTINYTTAEDYIYFGSFHPFNGFYFDVSTVNATSLGVTAEIWDGSTWQECVDVIDETESFSKSGYITYVPNRTRSWTAEDTVNDAGSTMISQLSDFTIYDHYWSRLSFDDTFTVGLRVVGHKFSNDQDLFSEYPMFNNSTLLASIKSGKTDYDEQSIRASSVLIDDLISRAIINSSSQVLDHNSFLNANIHKTAELIFNTLGSDYRDDKIDARKEYEKRMNKRIFNVDTNNNAELDKRETKTAMGHMFK